MGEARTGPVLCGVDFPMARLRSLASASGWPLAEASRSCSRIIVITERIAGDEIAGDGISACIEAAGLSEEAVLHAIDTAADCSFFLSLTTATAYRVSLAAGLAQAVARRAGLSAACCGDLELALQEAISNAVIHGNLGVESMGGTSLAALDGFSADITGRLGDPRLADRHVEILVRFEADGITVEVADEGSGCRASRCSGDGGPSGRGFRLIAVLARRYEMLDGGRRIRMSFDLPEASA